MRLLCVLLITFLLTSWTYGQVGINTIEPDPSAMLDITSSDKGVLFPRMDLNDLNEAAPVTNPQKSLMVWNTDEANGGALEGFYYWDGTKWSSFKGETSPELSGVYGQSTLSNDGNYNLQRNNNTAITGASSSSGSSGMNVSNQFSMSTQISGIYEVIFTITFRKEQNNGADQIQFFLSENNNPLPAATLTAALTRNKETVTFKGLVELRAFQTYGLGISRSNQAPNSVALTIFSDLTQFSLERQ
ncbi:hypothetical protein [Nonlabens sp. YIK11]|uniref:hypothetical protein n=1 Tax=Nonlabens sp. YIK11 TaxID=1453349 RepID=UPI0006DBFC6E|nr:hypothetical protein [Nonlabens sp. YIK11]